MTDYTNHDKALEHISTSMIKKEIYDNLIDESKRIFKNNNSIKGFTFPGSSFFFEKKFYNNLNNDITMFGIEKELKTFKKAINIVNQTFPNFKLFNMKDLKFFKTTSKTFDFMWLDYYGGFNISTEKSINTIFKRNILNDNNLLAITLKAGQEHGTKNPKYLQGKQFNNMTSYDIRKEKNKVNDERIIITLAVLEGIANKYNKSIVPISVTDYSDKYINTQSSRMLLYTMQVTDRITTKEKSFKYINKHIYKMAI